MNRISKCLIATLFLSATYAMAADGPVVQRIEAARQQKEAVLRSEHGILSFIGSYRLKEGDNRTGSAATDEIPLPAGSAPAQVGKFVLSNGHVTFTASDSVVVTLNGAAVTTVQLTDADSHAPLKLAVGRLQLLFFSSNREFTIFVSDPQSPNRANFGGLDWYPVNPEWRIPGKFVATHGDSKITYENALGGSNLADSPGYVVFTRNGHEYRLQVEGGPHGLTALFSDQTSGKSTYDGGRSLDIEKGEGDAVTLDFNLAVNKPCAVNPYTACSLSPRQNHLALEITAGEKTPHVRVARVATAPKRIQ
jgi:uncharacterized protein (DUF1684 family)